MTTHFLFIFSDVDDDSRFLSWVDDAFTDVRYHVFQTNHTFLVVNSAYSYAAYPTAQLLVKTCISERDAFYECLRFGDVNVIHKPPFSDYDNYRATHFCTGLFLL